MRTFTTLKTILMSALLLFLFANVSFAQCALFEDFENMSQNSAYAGRIVTTSSGSWMILGYSQMDVNDRYFGERSIRLRANNSDPASGAMTIPGENTEGANVIQMQFDKTKGIGTVSFYYGSYSGHSGGIVSVEYSTDGGVTWIKPDNNSVTSPLWTSVNAMQEFTVTVNVQGNARIRVIKYKQSGTQNSVNVDDICVTDYIPEGYVQAPSFNPPSGTTFINPIEVTITSETPGAVIRYTTNGSDPTESSPLYSNPVPISVTTTLKAKAWKEGEEPSTVSTAVYTSLTINSLAELRALAPAYTGGQSHGSMVYKYTGNAVVTHIQEFNNVKYIQDGSAAIMIFDRDGIIQGGIVAGDQLSNIMGTLSNYFGMLQIIPTQTCSVTGWWQTVPYTLITVNQLDDDHNNPVQAKVIRLENVMFTQTGNWDRGKYYNLKQNGMEYDSVVYTDKFEATYIGTPLPTIAVGITGVCNFKGATGIQTKNRIVPMDDVSAVKITDINKSAIKLAPNPANSFVNIMIGSPMRLEMYSLLGTLITTETLSEGSNTISVSNYPSGVYMMKLIDTNTGQSFIQKLVVK
ncbi:MAG: chitobiase/beta-hexosaminidase C-terminal domain-containing protein [Bacteroidetes bacterium]|nr:chitobiase/beta-hexosaminidase C-terminal domain-containing protein [Bacteroidota bacterium]MCL2302212.1 chitobiase/beta-hexosaminidase C-terminal domain-containing protein [Lentimicrobiaceae bacterium]MCL2302292.1 chitobiase/beta-hexosaminidase C-terminal domain-containing protein [Lentimicrobiaceae bacterium]